MCLRPLSIVPDNTHDVFITSFLAGKKFILIKCPATCCRDEHITGKQLQWPHIPG